MELDGNYDEEETIEVCKMSLHHKHYFAKSLHSSMYLSAEIKEAIRDKVFIGHSQSTLIYREASSAMLPDPAVKQSVWKQISATD